jgi:FKBP-type peptidyl-prolyl cis-trans isomerase
MIKKISIMALIGFFIGCSSKVNIPESVELSTWQDSISYSIGHDVGSNFTVREYQYETDSFFKGFVETYKTDTSYAYGASLASNFIIQGLEVNPSVFLSAFENSTNEDSLLLTKVEMGKILQKFNQQLREEATARATEKAEKNRVTNESFMEEYKLNHDDEIVTESGLIYRVLKEGFGDTPVLNDRVIVHYEGELIDGTVFDSSIERGEPATFQVTAVIQGWQEALTLMKVGAKWELVIPSTIGYGERTTGNIPGMSTLIFEVELLGIE